MMSDVAAHLLQTQALVGRVDCNPMAVQGARPAAVDWLVGGSDHSDSVDAIRCKRSLLRKSGVKDGRRWVCQDIATRVPVGETED